MITSQVGADGLRDCFRDPIPEIFAAATLLRNAAKAHLKGDFDLAAQLIRAADMPEIGEWLDPIWSGHNNHIKSIRPVSDLPPVLPREQRFRPRDAPPKMKRAILERDGFHCRLCGIPLIRPEVRKVLNRFYPDAARWTGPRPNQQHRGLQVMWVQYDHVVVHSRGGETSMDNLVVTCPACNYGRDRYMMSEVGLRDPRTHPRFPSWEGWREWDGLEWLLPMHLQIQSLDHDGALTKESIKVDFSDLRARILNSIPTPANHSARLWRVVENVRDQAHKNPKDDRLLHLMSRVGVLCRGLGEDLRAGKISSQEVATVLEQLADLGELSFEQWLQHE